MSEKGSDNKDEPAEGDSFVGVSTGDKSPGPSHRPSSAGKSPRSPYNSEKMDAAGAALEEKVRMQLAHELYMNENMEIGMPDPGSIVGQVKQIVHRAFWDSVRAGIEKQPPDYSHCIRLISEIRDIILELIPTGPQGQKLRSQITEVMDTDLYLQQITNDTFDLKSVSQYVVSILLSLCAPARDASVRAIGEMGDPVETLRAIFSVLDLIRLDFVNYQLRTLRPTLLAQSVQYEQSKFRAMLERDPGSLDKTKAWLATTVEAMRSENQVVTPTTTLECAFWRLIEGKVDCAPETVAMDMGRYSVLSKELSAVVFAASCILILQNGVGPPVQHDAFANKVRVVVYQLCSLEYISHPRDLIDHMAEKLLDVVKETNKTRTLTDDECDKIRSMLKQLSAIENPVYVLLWKRARMYFTSLSGSTSAITPPDGFSVCMSDLQGVASKYTHLVSYNRGVFGPFYADLIPQIMSGDGAGAASSTRDTDS